MLTEGIFTRDEWNHLLCLLNIMYFSTYSGSSNFKSSFSQARERLVIGAMSKRGQDQPRVMGLRGQKPHQPTWCCKVSAKRVSHHKDQDLQPTGENEYNKKRVSLTMGNCGSSSSNAELGSSQVYRASGKLGQKDSTRPKNEEDDTNKSRTISKTRSSLRLCSMTSSGKRMMRIASRMPSKSRTTRTGFDQNIGLFWSRFGKEVVGSSYDGQRKRAADKMVQQFKETGHPIFTATSALSRGILKQRKRQKYHSLQWRVHEHRTIIPNNSFCESRQYLRGCYELVLHICLEEGRKRTHSYTRGQSKNGWCGTRRSGNVDIFSEPIIGKPDDAEWGKIQRIGKEGSHDPIMWTSRIRTFCHSWKIPPSSTWWRGRTGTNHTFMQRKNLFSSLPMSQVQQAQRKDWSKRFTLWKFLTNVE